MTNNILRFIHDLQFLLANARVVGHNHFQPNLFQNSYHPLFNATQYKMMTAS
jgi:hypothetical protein